MPYDLTRCPQTDAEFREYFYTLIGRALGTSADDYQAVLSRAYPWNGTHLMIPAGVGPGVKLPPDAPFFGLTQQFSGVPKARVFLPSNTADENGYYTRCDQYLDDDPSGQGGFIWAWYYVAGHGYDPLLPADGGGGTTPPPDPQLEQRVETLEAQVAQLSEQLRELDALAVQRGEKIGLRMAEGQVLSADGGGGTAAGQPVTFQSRDEIGGAWEEFEVL